MLELRADKNLPHIQGEQGHTAAMVVSSGDDLFRMFGFFLIDAVQF